MTSAEAVQALRSGTGFVDLSSWRKVAVSGSEALAWLNDLLSADVSDLGPNRARRSLLLGPTGLIRAECTVAVPGDTVTLFQDPAQPRSIADLLAPYVLSSDVEVQDRTDGLALFAFPGLEDPPSTPGTAFSIPSCAGDGGVDLVALGGDRSLLERTLAKAYTPVGSDALEAWRIERGRARFGVDALEEDLPQEGGLAHLVSFEKGCYLGQETVAKVRNLGHPRRTVLHLRAEGPVSPGEPLEADGREAGRITSVAEGGGRWWLIARVRWDARDRALRTARGVEVGAIAPAA